MAVSYKVGSFNHRSGTGSQVVTGVGFEPKALILFAINATTEPIQVHSVVNIGFTDGTNERSIWVGSEDGVGTSNANRYGNSGKVINFRAVSDGSLQAEADLTSFDSNGFTLNWTTNTISGVPIKYVAIGGTDITDVEVGSFTSASGTGVQNVSTGVANADFLMLMNWASLTEDSLVTTGELALGMATSSSNRGCTTITSQDATGTSNTQRYQRTETVFQNMSSNSTSKLNEADFDGFTASGFDLDWSLANQRVIYYLTIKGGQWEVGNGTSPASASTKSFTTTFEPKGLLIHGFNRAASTAVNTSAVLTFGASDETTDVSIGVLDFDAVGTTDSARRSSSTSCVNGLGNTSETNELANVSTGGGFNATDFTLQFTKTNSTLRELIWAVVGDEDTGLGPSSQAVVIG